MATQVTSRETAGKNFIMMRKMGGGMPIASGTRVAVGNKRCIFEGVSLGLANENVWKCKANVDRVGIHRLIRENEPLRLPPETLTVDRNLRND